MWFQPAWFQVGDDASKFDRTPFEVVSVSSRTA